MSDRAEPGLEAAIRVFDARTTELWALAVAFFGVGDLATTVVGLSGGHLVEAGPLASTIVDELDVGALLGLKLAALGVCLLLWRLTPRPSAASVPLGLTAFGVLITAWNAALLLQRV